jgi:hypothetical protein
LRQQGPDDWAHSGLQSRSKVQPRLRMKMVAEFLLGKVFNRFFTKTGNPCSISQVKTYIMLDRTKKQLFNLSVKEKTFFSSWHAMHVVVVLCAE